MGLKCWRTAITASYMYALIIHCKSYFTFSNFLGHCLYKNTLEHKFLYLQHCLQLKQSQSAIYALPKNGLKFSTNIIGTCIARVLERGFYTTEDSVGDVMRVTAFVASKRRQLTSKRRQLTTLKLNVRIAPRYTQHTASTTPWLVSAVFS